MSVRRDPALRIALLGDANGGVELPLEGTLVLGASADLAGYVVTGQGVEDAHCAVGILKDGGWGIKDLGSRYGTFINGAKVQSARLEAGDTVVLGSAGLRVFDPRQPSGETAQAAPTDPPRRIGGYRIERLLGRGGMGEVLLATQESLHRPVALKLLSKKLASDGQFVREFHSEARSAAALSHPNVVIVYDVGEFEGEHLLAMEYMPGGSLEDRIIREGKIPWREVLDILHNAASGLAYAESKGIVHRDIKPANLMVAASGTVKIADLGLAKSIEDLESDDRGQGKKVFGTPHFISPEQARGLAVDHRSDLYSLGATAYRLLSGRTPFEGDTAREIVRARFVSDPAPLARLDLGVPADVGELVQRLMARKPEQRFLSATALLSALDLLRLRADHGPTRAESAPRGRNPLRVALFLVPAALGIGALGIGGWYFLGTGEESNAGEPNTGGTPASVAVFDGAAPADQDPDSDAFFGAKKDPRAPAPEKDEEARLDRREREARIALGRIPEELRPEDRLIELERFAGEHDGTDTAGEARTEIARLETGLSRARNRDQLRAKDVALGLIQLRTNAGWPPATDEPPPVFQYLQRIQAFLPTAALRSDPTFERARRSLADEVVRIFAENAEQSLLRVDELALDGSFDRVRKLLKGIRHRLDPGELVEGEAEGIGRLRALRLSIAQRLENLGVEEEARLAALGRVDRTLIAQELGRGSGTHGELWDLKLLALETRLARTRGKLRTNEAVGTIQRLERRVDRARSAITMLVSSYSRGNWRRKTVSVPNGKRSVGREVVRMATDGLVVSTENNGTELLPWSVLSRTEGALAQLFRGRLSRPYDATEIGGIATLLSLAAVGRSAEAARPGLDLDRQTLLTPSAASASVDAFDSVLDWLETHREAGRGPRIRPIERDPGPVQLLADTSIIEEEIGRERAASEVLSRAVLAYQDGAFTEAISKVEYLLGEYGDTFMVVLLSDGTL